MRPLRLAFLLAAPLALLAGCLGEAGPESSSAAASDPPTVVTPVPADAPLAEVRVRAGDLTLWTQPSLAPETRSGQRVWVLRGRTSRNLVSISSWVPDDAFGHARVLSKRTFEVTLDDGHELNSILSGLPLFLDVEVATGTPRHHAAALWIEARLDRFTGSRAIWLDRALPPVHVGGDEPLRYRNRAIVSGAQGSLAVRTPAGAAPVVTALADGAFTIDFTYDELAGALGADRARSVWDAGTVQKRAGIGVAVSALGLSNLDGATAWPHEPCLPEVWACMQAAGADPSACGTYRQVQHCVFEPPSCGDADGIPVLTSREPGPEVTAVLDAARGQLPDGRSIGLVVGAAHTPCADGAPAIGAVNDGLVRSFQWQEQWSNAGALDPTELEAILANYHLEALLPAARTWAGSETMVPGLVKTEFMGAPSAMTWIDFVVFYFPETGSLLAVQLVTVEL